MSKFSLGIILSYLSAIFPIGSAIYIFYRSIIIKNGLKLFSETTFFEIIAAANLFTNGLCLFLLTYFALRKKMKWAWYMGMFFVYFTGSLDLFATLRADTFPTPIFPMTLGTFSLILTYSEIFKTKSL